MSFGFECGKPKEPGVYSRVTTYRDWIYSAMQHYDSYLNNWFSSKNKDTFYATQCKYGPNRGIMDSMGISYGPYGSIVWVLCCGSIMNIDCIHETIHFIWIVTIEIFNYPFHCSEGSFSFFFFIFCHWMKITFFGAKWIFLFQKNVFEVILKTLVYLIGK